MSHSNGNGHNGNGHNGNGNGHNDGPSALEEFERRLAAQQVEETLEPVDPIPELDSSMFDDDDEVTDPDPLSSWKRRDPWKPVTLEQIHAGLVANYEYAKAAIEGNLRLAADVHEVVSAVDVRTQQIEGLTVKLESTTTFVHQIDEETAKTGKMLDTMRRDVQFLKDDVREIKVSSSEAARQLPVIKDMLGEILARLPDPGTHRK